MGSFSQCMLGGMCWGAERKQPRSTPSQGGGVWSRNHVHLCDEGRDLRPGWLPPAWTLLYDIQGTEAAH